MSEELKPAAVHDANVFLPGSLGPVRREVVLAYEHDRVVDQLRAELAALKAGQGEAVEYQQLSRYGHWERIEKSVFDLGLLGSCPERFRALCTAPPASADAVSVPRELLGDLRDLAADDAETYRQGMGAVRPLQQANRDKTVADCDALLAQVEDFRDQRNELIAGNDAMHLEMAELRAQVEAMRAALESITDIEDELYGGDWDEIERARDIASAALQSNP